MKNIKILWVFLTLVTVFVTSCKDNPCARLNETVYKISSIDTNNIKNYLNTQLWKDNVFQIDKITIIEASGEIKNAYYIDIEPILSESIKKNNTNLSEATLKKLTGGFAQSYNSIYSQPVIFQMKYQIKLDDLVRRLEGNKKINGVYVSELLGWGALTEGSTIQAQLNFENQIKNTTRELLQDLPADSVDKDQLIYLTNNAKDIYRNFTGFYTNEVMKKYQQFVDKISCENIFLGQPKRFSIKPNTTQYLTQIGTVEYFMSKEGLNEVCTMSILGDLVVSKKGTVNDIYTGEKLAKINLRNNDILIIFGRNEKTRAIGALSVGLLKGIIKVRKCDSKGVEFDFLSLESDLNDLISKGICYMEMNDGLIYAFNPATRTVSLGVRESNSEVSFVETSVLASMKFNDTDEKNDLQKLDILRLPIPDPQIWNIKLADIPEQEKNIEKYLKDEYSGYPDLVLKLAQIMENRRLKYNAVPLTIINGKYYELKVADPSNVDMDKDIEILKKALLEAWKEKNSHYANYTFDKIFE